MAEIMMTTDNKVEAPSDGATDKTPKPTDLRTKVVVYATDKAPFKEPPFDVVGGEIEVHPEVAAFFVKKGYATVEKPTEKQAENTKK